MAKARQIQRFPVRVQEKTVNFYAHRQHRYLQRELKLMVALLERIFDSDFAHAVGRHGELMFDAALGRNGFRAEARNTRTWQGTTWETTNHNLDRIVTRDGRAYGVEIKNTQNWVYLVSCAVSETCLLPAVNSSANSQRATTLMTEISLHR